MTTIIHDDLGNPITEFPLVGANRVLPVAIESGFDLGTYDYVSIFYPNDGVTEKYTFKTGGASGTQTAIVTIIYRTTNKDEISTITKV